MEGAGEEEEGGALLPLGAGVGLLGEEVGLGGAAQGAPLESLPGQVEPIGRGRGRTLWRQLEHIDVRSLAIYEDGHSVLLPKPGQPGWGLLAQEVPHRLGDCHFVLAGASTGCHSGQDERHLIRKSLELACRLTLFPPCYLEIVWPEKTTVWW